MEALGESEQVSPNESPASVRFGGKGSRCRMRTEDVRWSTILFRGVSGQPHVKHLAGFQPRPGGTRLLGTALSRSVCRPAMLEAETHSSDSGSSRLRFPRNPMSWSQVHGTEKQVFLKRRRPLVRFHCETSAFGAAHRKSVLGNACGVSRKERKMRSWNQRRCSLSLWPRSLWPRDKPCGHSSASLG